jgi:hypothetical protein
MSFGEIQRGERVGGLSGLRYEDRQIAGITEFCGTEIRT